MAEAQRSTQRRFIDDGDAKSNWKKQSQGPSQNRKFQRKPDFKHKFKILFTLHTLSKKGSRQVNMLGEAPSSEG
jgi:hypothetical protein